MSEIDLDEIDLEKPSERFLNRELSWLDFNERVLELAEDAETPLLERVRFCAIFASNLDEFFMVRVAGLARQKSAGVTVRSMDGRTPRETLTEIRNKVLDLVSREQKLWRTELVGRLASEGIEIVDPDHLDGDEIAELRQHFDREVYPLLTPLGVGPGQPFPYISGLSISLAVFVRDPESLEVRFARVKVPEGLDRFVEVGGDGHFVTLEDVIASFLPTLFPGMEVLEHAVFRVTRDADFDVSDEADDLLEAVEGELRRRRFGDIVRLEISENASPAMLEAISEGLGVTPDEVYEIGGLIDPADLTQIAALDRPDLKYEPWVPVTPPRLANVRSAPAFFSEIRKGDILVHLPYEQFNTSVAAFLNAGATDPDVLGIKTTVYRTSDESPVVPALIEAAEEGKQTACVVELKARFDELRNIEWARRMEQAGVHVVYGFPNLKIHAKTTLIVRREPGELRRYAHIGTGNYNSVTAKIYEDFGLFTDDTEIVADIADLFNYVTGFGRPQKFRKLLVAPFNLRSKMVDQIRKVATAAREGKAAEIKIKVNALTDKAIIEALYDASNAGAEIEIIARSFCSLRPGVPGMSEKIAVRSVVGRFLEHSRVFTFRAGDDTATYMGSGDLMPRNLSSRIEVLTPIEDARIRAEIENTFDALLRENTNAWLLQPDGTWARLRPKKGEKRRSAHETLMRRAKKRAERRPSARKVN